MAVTPIALPRRRTAFAELFPHELFMLLFAAFFVLVAAIAQVPQWLQVILRMAAVSSVIFAVCAWATQRSLPEWLRLFYVVPLVPIFFKTSELMSFPLHGHDFDAALVAADRMLFGVNPTYWIYQHIPNWPALTEYLMICYSLFYFLPVAVAVELFLRARNESNPDLSALDMQRMQEVFFIIIYGFLLSYASYLLFPSIGPRFTVHNFFLIDKELPGIFLTEPLRTILNRGENIMPGMPIDEVLAHVTRDAFPSGHADITLLSIILAFQFRVKIRWVILIVGSSLIVSTVYLRYHYVIDLVGGVLLAAITLYTWRWVRDGMIALQERLTAP